MGYFRTRLWIHFPSLVSVLSGQHSYEWHNRSPEVITSRGSSHPTTWTLLSTTRIVYTIILIINHKKRVMNTSGVLFIFWLCLSIGTAFNYRTILTTAFSDNSNPENESSFLSRLTFSWFTPMIMNGYRKPLTTEDMWSLSTQNRTNVFIKQFNKHWKPMQQNSAKHAINIFPVVLKTYWPTLLIIAFIKLLISLLTFTQPLVLDRLITFITSHANTSSDTGEPIWRGYLYAGAMFVSPVLASVLKGQCKRLENLMLMKIKSCVTSSIRLSSAGRMAYTTGDVVNLISNDMHYLKSFFSYVNNLWLTPTIVIIATCLLWPQLGAATLAGVAVMILLIPINSLVLTREHRLWRKIITLTDRRVSAITEIINNIKVLKLYAWEPAFMKRVSERRASECRELIMVMVSGVFKNAISTATPYLVSLCSFTAFLYMSDQNILDPNKAFVSLLLFNIIKGSIQTIPALVTATIICKVSVKRMNAYLNANEVNESFVDHKPNQKTPIIVKNASFNWDNNCNDSVLKNINIEIERQSLVAVVGRVGAG
ncbi:unnamed protein product, partial [Medioppia subpectinata]